MTNHGIKILKSFGITLANIGNEVLHLKFNDCGEALHVPKPTSAIINSPSSITEELDSNEPTIDESTSSNNST